MHIGRGNIDAVVQDMKHEAALLEAFAEIPAVTLAWLRNAGGEQDGPLTLTVSTAHRLLPSTTNL